MQERQREVAEKLLRWLICKAYPDPSVFRQALPRVAKVIDVEPEELKELLRPVFERMFWNPNKAEPKIMISSTGIPNTLALFMTTEICQVPGIFSGVFWRNELGNPGPSGEPLIDKLLTQVPSIKCIDIQTRHSFFIRLDEGVDWTEILPQVVEILKEAFGDKAQRVIVDDQREIVSSYTLRALD